MLIDPTITQKFNQKDNSHFEHSQGQKGMACEYLFIDCASVNCFDHFRNVGQEKYSNRQHFVQVKAPLGIFAANEVRERGKGGD